MQRVNITLPADLIRHLKQTIPARKRSSFIAEALKDKLSQQNQKKALQKELIKSLKANAKYYEKIAQEWEQTEEWPD